MTRFCSVRSDGWTDEGGRDDRVCIPFDVGVPPTCYSLSVARGRGLTCPRRSNRDAALLFFGGRLPFESTFSRTRFLDPHHPTYSQV